MYSVCWVVCVCVVVVFFLCSIENMYLPLVPHQNEPLPSPIITDNEYHICTRLRSTIPRSS